MAETKSSPAFQELKQWMATEFKKIQEQNTKQDDTLNEIKQRFDMLDGEIFEIKNQCDRLADQNRDLEKTIEKQHQRIQQLESYTRKENLRFYNVPESRGNTPEEDLRKFMGRQLDIEEHTIGFSTVYRVGLSRNNRPRCIIAKFLRRSDCDKVKAAGINLRGTTFGISEDLPPEWAEIRRLAHPIHVKPAKQQGKRVKWRGPQLFIDGVEVELERTRTIKPAQPQLSSPTPRPNQQHHQHVSPSNSRQLQKTDSNRTLTNSCENITDQDQLSPSESEGDIAETAHQVQQTTNVRSTRSRTLQKLKQFAHKSK